MELLWNNTRTSPELPRSNPGATGLVVAWRGPAARRGSGSGGSIPAPTFPHGAALLQRERRYSAKSSICCGLSWEVLPCSSFGLRVVSTSRIVAAEPSCR